MRPRTPTLHFLASKDTQPWPIEVCAAPALAPAAASLLLGSRLFSLLGGILRARLAERSAVDLASAGFAVTFTHAIRLLGGLEDRPRSLGETRRASKIRPIIALPRALRILVRHLAMRYRRVGLRKL